MIKCTTFLGGTKWLPPEKLAFRPSAYALILVRDRLLLGHIRRTGKYCLPGGGVEPGEKLEVALRREVKEETGLEVVVRNLLGFQEDFFYYDPGDEAYHCFLFFYRCTPISLNLIPDAQIDDGEVTSLHWVPLASLQPGDFQNHGPLILNLLESLSLAPQPEVGK